MPTFEFRPPTQEQVIAYLRDHVPYMTGDPFTAEEYEARLTDWMSRQQQDRDLAGFGLWIDHIRQTSKPMP